LFDFQSINLTCCCYIVNYSWNV